MKKRTYATILAGLLLSTATEANGAIFLPTWDRKAHISGFFALYIISGDAPGKAGGFEEKKRYVRKARNCDLWIKVPLANGRYSIRFFDDRDQLQFEIRQIRDDLLIVEKANFRHAGLFRYKLYRDNALVENHVFTIKSNP